MPSPWPSHRHWSVLVLQVFSSDNGGPAFSDQHAASNYPKRGGKYSSFEGGINVASFVSGGVLPAERRGKTDSGIVHVADWYSTFCYLAGVDPTDSHPGVPDIDSLNQWPVITGTATSPVRTEVFTVTDALI